jgi:dTDP-4-dehydrorhamnose reductase
MKVLILGNKGSLGKTFEKVFSDTETVGLDRSELDITDEAAVLETVQKVRPNLVINCAAYNAVDDAEENLAAAELINGTAVGFIAKASAQTGAVMVHYSTNYVFDGNNPEGYNEDAIPKPLSAYGRSKVLGEIELQKNLESFYLIRTAMLFGDKGSGKKSFVDIMLDLGRQEKSVKAVKDEFGQPTYVLDLAQATRALIEEKKPFGIYHLTNTGEASWFDLAKEIFAVKNISADLTAVDGGEFNRKAKRPKYGILNNTKYLELRPWTEALTEYLKNL